ITMEPSAVWCIEEVFHTFCSHANEHDLVCQCFWGNCSGEQCRQGEGTKRPSRSFEIEQELIAACISADIPAIICCKWSDGGRSEPEILRVLVVRRRQHH